MAKRIHGPAYYRAAYEYQRSFISVKEIAEQLGEPEDRIRRLCKQGVIPARQNGAGGHYVINRAEYEAWRDGRKVDDAPRLASEQSVRLVAELTSEQIDALKAGSLVIELRPAGGRDKRLRAI